MRSSSPNGVGVSEPEPTPDEAEKQSREDFCRAHAAPEYRTWFNRLYPWWRQFKATYFPMPECECPASASGRPAPGG